MSASDARKLTYNSAGDQLDGLRSQIKKKLDAVLEKMAADEAIKQSLVKEAKATTKKLEIVDTRLSTIKAAHKEYMKTINELNFALAKIEEAARGMEDKFASLSRLNAED